MADQSPEFPVYEKDGKTQIAATPAREVQLRFDGWRKREVSPAAASDSGSSSGPSKSSRPSKSTDQ